MNENMTYEEIVLEAQTISGDFKWRIADLALLVEKKFGKEGFKKFCEDVEQPRQALKVYMSLAIAYPPDKRNNNMLWSVHQALRDQDDRFDLVANHKWTYMKALQLVSYRRHDLGIDNKRTEGEGIEAWLERMGRTLSEEQRKKAEEYAKKYEEMRAAERPHESNSHATHITVTIPAEFSRELLSEGFTRHQIQRAFLFYHNLDEIQDDVIKILRSGEGL